MEKKEQIYEGKAKILYATDDKDAIIFYYKDDATAGNGAKKGTITDKGIMNNKMTTFFFNLLEQNGIKTNLIKVLNDREMLVKKLDMIPLEVVMRNVVAGSLANRVGKPEGTHLNEPVVELYLKSDELGDPMINHYHVQALGIATKEEVAQIEALGLKINQILKDFLKTKKVDLVDFKLEFGRFNGEIILGDEISPDNCRFWDSDTHEKLDKDRFRRDLGNVEEAYQEMLRRLTGK